MKLKSHRKGDFIKKFEISSEDDNGKKIVIEINEFQYLALINICIVKKRNKHIGLKLARLYLELGNNSKKNLQNMGIDYKIIYDGYEKMKKILGEIN